MPASCTPAPPSSGPTCSTSQDLHGDLVDAHAVFGHVFGAQLAELAQGGRTIGADDLVVAALVPVVDHGLQDPVVPGQPEGDPGPLIGEVLLGPPELEPAAVQEREL